ncbi:hypothetical protein [Niabella beijingensis]|uniref:hypothetical protein n=1 Tax=Niabella beijingensis TaxID=2872700 RepID=UPI001CBDE827|nr:hypothetical protein [Niabella beijingensis]MBZ4189041.1 hypothetical protein [Niabella beijingensis]
MKAVFYICCFLFSVAAQAQPQYYNWSGFPLPVYERPSAAAGIVERIPAGNPVNVIPGTAGPSYTIYLSYYGDTSVHKKEEGNLNPVGSFYPLKTTWVKVQGARGTGYVPLGLLSHIPYKPLYKKSESQDYQDIPVLDALKTYFGKPLSYRKQELEKQAKEEIHFTEQYRFTGGITYRVLQQYAEEGGPGGDEHRIFLPHTSLSEAVLFLLEITRGTRIQPEEQKSVNKIKSLYDSFSWWYQPEQYNDAGEPVKEKNRIDFEYASEGGSTGATFLIRDQGVEIIYSYGGC